MYTPTILLTSEHHQCRCEPDWIATIGELENWLSTEHIAASKQTKWAWANDAAAQVRLMERKEDDVWEFMTKVGTYLTGTTLPGTAAVVDAGALTAGQVDTPHFATPRT